MARKFARISAKISTMPRLKSEATTHLELYKLQIERQRLQQEMETIEQRRQQILDRLSVLDMQVAQLDKQSDKRLGKTTLNHASEQNPAAAANPFGSSEAFNTLFLEY